MTKKYLKISDLVPPALLDQFMSQPRTSMNKRFFDIMFDKYKDYGPCILRHSANSDQSYLNAWKRL